MKPASPDQGSAFQLRFESLFCAGRAYVFPCDAAGHVDMNALGEQARNKYLYARALIGRELAMPQVQGPHRALT